MEAPRVSSRRASAQANASHLVASLSSSLTNLSGMARSSSRSSGLSRATRRQHQPRLGEWTLGETLGKGEFGKVKLGWKRDKAGHVRHAAVKLMRQDMLKPNAERRTKVYREINALKHCHHPNIVHLEEVLQNDNYIGIVLEYAPNGELFNYIMERGHLEEATSSLMFAQLVSAVHYLHHKGMVHRDLKLENILLDRHSNVVVTDFGFANSFRDGTSHLLMGTSCGSPCYAAPELVMSGNKYDGRKVDVWSCGVILYAMLAGYLPFDDDPSNPESDDINKLYHYITTTKLTFPNFVGPTPRDLIKRILVVDPAERATLYAVRNHVWLSTHAAFLSVTPREFDESYQMKKKLQREAQTAAAAEQKEASMRHVRSSSMAAVPSAASPAPAAPGLARSASSAAAAAAAATHQRRQSIQAVPTKSGLSPPVSYGVSRRAEPTKLSDEVTSLGIAENGSAGNAKRTRLPVARKPRPISFQPASSSAMAPPMPEAKGTGFNLEGVAHSSLYSARTSQPRVELSHVPSKSGEMSRPVSMVDASDASRPTTPRTPPIRPVAEAVPPLPVDAVESYIAQQKQQMRQQEPLNIEHDESGEHHHHHHHHEHDVVHHTSHHESHHEGHHEGHHHQYATQAQQTVAQPQIETQAIPQDHHHHHHHKRASSTVPVSTPLPHPQQSRIVSTPQGPVAPKDTDLDKRVKQRWYHRHSAMPVPTASASAAAASTSREQRQQRRHSSIPVSTSIPSSLAVKGATVRETREPSRGSIAPERAAAAAASNAHAKEGAVKKIFGYLKRRSIIA